MICTRAHAPIASASRRHRRHVVEDAPVVIDVNPFAVSGVLGCDDVSGVVRAGNGSLAFSVHRGGAETVVVRLVGVVEIADTRTTMQATVPVVWSEQRIGRHAWWLCPACGRRARILYSTDCVEVGCRQCLGLVHRSVIVRRRRAVVRTRGEGDAGEPT